MNVASASSAYVTGNPAFAGSIDELRIVGSFAGADALELDNLIFTEIAPTPTAPVSEPGTLALFGLGLMGLGFARRRKTAS